MAAAADGARSPQRPAPARRRAGRPSVRVLSRRLIIETGLRLIDERGADGAGMRAIAAELGVRPSALYNHVAGRAELIAGVRELLSDRIPTGVFEHEPWDEALAEWAHHYRVAFAAHPSTVALLAVLPLAEESATTRMYEAVIAAMLRAGWPRDRALTALVALESFILGSALDLAAADDMLDPGPRTDVPAFAVAYEARRAALAAAGQRPADAAFELGLRALLAGLRAELAAVREEAGSGPVRPSAPNTP